MIHLGHLCKGILVSNKEIKKETANLVAVSIFIDSIVRKAEINAGCEILENLFNGEDYEYLTEEVDILIESFSTNPINYVNSRQQAVDFVEKHVDMKKEFIQIMTMIFKSDHEIHKKEEELLSLFNYKEKQ